MYMYNVQVSLYCLSTHEACSLAHLACFVGNPMYTCICVQQLTYWSIKTQNIRSTCTCIHVLIPTCKQSMAKFGNLVFDSHSPK